MCQKLCGFLHVRLCCLFKKDIFFFFTNLDTTCFISLQKCSFIFLVICIILLLFKFSCLHFKWPHPLSPIPLRPPAYPLRLWPCVLCTCSLMALSLFSLFFPPLLPGYCQYLLHFKVSGCIFLACLYGWLGSTYRWDHMVFVFHSLAYFS